MRPSTGHLAAVALFAAGFDANDQRWWLWDEQRPRGPYSVTFLHPDGREMQVTTGAGNGWQPGRLRTAVAGGPWNVTSPLECTTPAQVRRLLAEHEPDREQTYQFGGGTPIRQARALDGRERDILCRILSDIIRACRTRESQDLPLRALHLEGDEARRLVEMRTVLETRDN